MRKSNANIALVQALGTGYLVALKETPNATTADTDTWIVHGELDVNLCGAEYSDLAPDGGLVAFAYKAGWRGSLPPHLFSVTISPSLA